MLGPIIRPRRLRRETIRDLVHEYQLSVSQLVQPYFLNENPNGKDSIQGFSGIYRWGIEVLCHQIESDLDRGIRSFLLFGHSSEKDSTGSKAIEQTSLVAISLRKIKERFGTAAIIFSDVCLCPYTSHGHCGLVKDDEVLNDESLEVLSEMALVHAQAGTDFVAPSDMMDGRVAAIRRRLDQMGYHRVGILSYTAKYASSYYGPFRQALASLPQKMDRKNYQMDYRNSHEALRELELDLSEGADIVMVKPALPYLDIISLFKRHSTVPVAAYSVSADYEMVKQLAKHGMANEEMMVQENLIAIKRAGAQLIITYYASEARSKGWV